MVFLSPRRARNWQAVAVVVSMLSLTFANAAVDENQTVHPDKWPAVKSPFPNDPVMEAAIQRLLAGMTIEEKVGQMLMVELPFFKPDELVRYPIGSILNGGDSTPRGYTPVPLDEWVSYADSVYGFVKQRPGSYVPILWGSDAVHGQNKFVGAIIYPHNIGLGAANDPELVYQIASATAQAFGVAGQNWNFAPTLAVVQNYRWGRTYEGFSSDPKLISRYAERAVSGYQGELGKDFMTPDHVVATAKHFIGDGATQDGIDQGRTQATEDELIQTQIPGFEAALKAGVLSVMVSYSSWEGVKMHASRYLLTDILKTRMGFDGVVVGDWNGHTQVPGCSKTSCATVIKAGVDVLMVSDSWRALFNNTVAQVKQGEIPIERINDAVTRVLRLKFRAGLFERPMPSEQARVGDASLLALPEHRALARRAVRESLVLLKNDKNVLPMKANARIHVVGPAADDIGYQSGGWTLTWQGGVGHNENFPNAESILKGVQAASAAAGGSVEYRSAGDTQGPVDYAVVVVAEKPYAEMKGDVPDLSYERLPGVKILESVVDDYRARKVPVVVVLLSGRPLWVTPLLKKADAFVAAWLPGTEGGGIADVLMRNQHSAINYPITGKLSFDWPSVSTSQANPLFPRGFGLHFGSE